MTRLFYFLYLVVSIKQYLPYGIWYWNDKKCMLTWRIVLTQHVRLWVVPYFNRENIQPSLDANKSTCRGWLCWFCSLIEWFVKMQLPKWLCCIMHAKRKTVAVPTTVHCDHHLILAKNGAEGWFSSYNTQSKAVFDFVSVSDKYGGFWNQDPESSHRKSF
jgi:hypothetical protein